MHLSSTFPKWHLCQQLHRECRATGQGRRDPVRGRLAFRSKRSCKHCPSLTLPSHSVTFASTPLGIHKPAPCTVTQVDSVYCAGEKKKKSKAKLLYGKTHWWALLPMGSRSEPRIFIPLSHAVVLSCRCRKPRSPRYRHTVNYTQLPHASEVRPQHQRYKSLWKTVTRKTPTKLNSTHPCKKCFQWWKQKQNHMN